MRHFLLLQLTFIAFYIYKREHWFLKIRYTTPAHREHSSKIWVWPCKYSMTMGKYYKKYWFYKIYSSIIHAICFKKPLSFPRGKKIRWKTGDKNLPMFLSPFLQFIVLELSGDLELSYYLCNRKSVVQHWLTLSASLIHHIYRDSMFPLTKLVFINTVTMSLWAPCCNILDAMFF